MEKIKVEDMACFKQVAKVIGVANARKELERVVDSLDIDCFSMENSDELLNSTTVGCAFCWDDAPQRYTFWLDIEDGINPYNQ
jgi:hypothetical protein